MSKKNIMGVAFDGSSVLTASLDPLAEPPVVTTDQCDLGVPVSELISGDAEAGEECAEQLKTVVGSSVSAASVSLPSEHALLRVMQLPTTEPDEIAGMVNLQIDKMSPFPVEDMVVAYEVLSQGNGSVAVAGIAVRRKIVEKVWRVLGESGVVPVRVDINSLVWWHYIKKSGSLTQEGRQVFILFRDSASEFIIVHDGVPVLFRAFVINEGQTDLEFMSEICDEIHYTLMSLEIELGAFTDFSITLFHAADISDELIGVPAGLCDGNLELVNINLAEKLSEAVAERCNNVGVIDLTPASLVNERIKLGFRKKMIKAFVAIASVWIVSVAVLFGGVYFQKIRLNRVSAQRDAIKAEARDIRELRRKVATIDLYVDRSRSALEVLRDVCLKQPQGVDLTMLNYRKGAELRLSGESSAVNFVYEFKKALDGSPLFESVTLSGPQKVRGKEVFEVTAAFPGGEE